MRGGREILHVEAEEAIKAKLYYVKKGGKEENGLKSREPGSD
jgi:hypothetical protein